MNKVINYLYVSIVGAGLMCTQQVLAEAVDTEQNHPVSLAQFITPGSGEFRLSGVLGTVSGPAIEDYDFYRFFGHANDVITIDIDQGAGGMRSVDTVLAVFTDGPDYTMLSMNDDSFPVDEGSLTTMDSRIVDLTLPVTGTYYIGVSFYPRYFRDGTVTINNTSAPYNGDYQLVISGVTNPVMHMNIAIKPGNNEIAPLNPRARGRVPVALLSNDGFDPKNVVVDSLRFGHDGSEESLKKCNNPGADLNHDGVKDMVCHFDNQTAAFRKGDLEGILTGQLKDGTVFEGRGLLKVVPEKAN